MRKRKASALFLGSILVVGPVARSVAISPVMARVNVVCPGGSIRHRIDAAILAVAIEAGINRAILQNLFDHRESVRCEVTFRN
jgi:hypothetical protein